MALELLAGPFPIAKPDGTALDIAEALSNPTSLYDDVVGLASYSSVLGGFCVSQMDGTTYVRAYSPRPNYLLLDLQTPADWLIVDALFVDRLFKFDRKTGSPVAQIGEAGATAAYDKILARTADRFLGVSGANVRFKPLDLSAGWVNEATLTGAGSGAAVSLSRTRVANVLCIAYQGGQIVFYNHATKTQTAGTAFIGANHGAWYSPKHDVYIALTGTTTNLVSVYANAVAPTTIGTPFAVPALTRGRASQIRVTVSGANGEPAVGELVDWTMTGGGTLLATQSTTDTNGVASVGYAAPLSLTTSPTFTATLQC
jgi:hypothetical protein